MLSGKGMWMWIVERCGEPTDIAKQAKTAGLTHILIKLADGVVPYFGRNYASTSTRDFTMELVQALKSENVEPVCWQYVYGRSPIQEADIVIQRMQSAGIKKLIIDAESEYKAPGMGSKAVQYCQRLKSLMPDIRLALSSYRFPVLHRELPWAEFGQFMECYVPQVYWQGSHNPVEQLARCLREYKALPYPRAVYSAGAAYREYGWQPDVGEITKFLKASKDLYGLGAANLWEWYDAKIRFPAFWAEIVNFSWGGTVPPPPYVPTHEEKVEIMWRELQAHYPSWNWEV